MAESQVMLDQLQVLLYACVLIKAAKPHVANPLRYVAWRRRNSPARHKLKVQRASVSAVHHKAPKEPHCELDVNVVLLINEKNALRFGLRSGQWQNVLFYPDADPVGKKACKFSMKNVRKRWIQVLTCPEVKDEQCLVSPILYHNLQRDGQYRDFTVEFTNSNVVLTGLLKTLLALWNETHATEIGIEMSAVPCSSPGMASEVHVKVIEASEYKYGSEVELLLKDHFTVPKVVCEGDVLALSIPNHLAHEFAPSNSIVPPKNVFIKVTQVKGKSGQETKHCVLVTVGNTNLYLAGAVHSLLPSYMESFDDEGEIDVPPILRETYLRLKNILQMIMQERSQRRQHYFSDKISNATIPKNNTKKCEDKVNIVEKESKAEPQHRNQKPGKRGSEKHLSNNSAAVLLLGPPGCGSERVIKLAASALGLGTVWVNCWQLKGDTSGSTEARLRQVFVRASVQGPCVLVLQNVDCLSKDRDGEEDARVVAALREEVARLPQLEPQVVLAATAPDTTSLSDDLWSVWSHQESVPVPDQTQRSAMLHWLLSPTLATQHVLPLAQRTAGYMLGDFYALLNAANRHCVVQQAQAGGDGREDSTRQAQPLQYSSLLKALDELQESRSEALGAPHIPQVQWGEVGGLEEAKRQIINTIQLPLRYPALVAGKLCHSGVLLYGPPGTGKTLLAKAVATECGLSFLSVKGPELLNMYVGQSEENVRQVFSRAQAAAPCVIFFDELDSLAPNRGRSGDSGGVMDRIVSALLAELDGVAGAADVFVLAATNRPDLIDPALLRPGRFEKLVFLGACEDRADQIKILKAITSKVPLSPTVTLERVVSLLPLSVTGADLYALVTDALYTALHRTTQHVTSGRLQEEEVSITVTEEDFVVAANNLVPSVTPQELAHYRTLNTTTARR